MDRTLKVVTGFDAANAIVYFCSLILMKPENPVSKNTLPKWLSTALALLSSFSTGMITSDNWGSYAGDVQKDKHLSGKIFTQRSERNNLTLRTRIKRLTRKTICSRAIELHEKVIGAFIEKYMICSLEL